MPNIVTENVFKFAMVRPPQRASKNESSFTVFDSAGQKTAFMNTIIDLRNQEQGDLLAKEESQHFLQSSGIKSLEEDTELSAISNLVDWMESGMFVPTNISDLEEALALILGSSTSTYLISPEYDSAKERLWNSYIASIIDETSPFQYRDEGLKGIQAISLIEMTANPSAGQTAQEILNSAKESTPVFFEGILRGSTPYPPGGELGTVFQPLTSLQQHAITTFSNFEKAYKELLGVQDQKFEQARQAERNELQDLNAIFDNPETKPTFPANEELTQFTAGMSGIDISLEPPWRLTEANVENLSSETRALLVEHSIDLTKMTIGEATILFEREMDKLIYSSFRTQAIEMVGVGVGYKNGGINRLSTTLPMAFDLQMDVPKSLELIAQTAARENYSNTYQTPQYSSGEIVSSVRILGIADLKVVRQTLQRYDLGEISHIQNVMRSEKRERTHRRFQQKEEEFITTKETTEENERSLTTSERFELQKEAEQTVQEDSRLELGANISSNFGPVKASATAGYATSNARTDAQRNASTYARDVTNRSVEKITKKATESKRSRNLLEIEDTNLHAFDNTQGIDHITGIYRWVDKVYQAQVYNYGKRLMLEFVIPEPSAFFLHSQSKPQAGKQTIEKPFDLGALSPSDILPSNYTTWIQMYGAENVQPPPPLYHYTSASTSRDYQNNLDPTAQHNITLELPDDYAAKYASVGYQYSCAEPPVAASLIAVVGTLRLGMMYNKNGNGTLYRRNEGYLSSTEKKLAISVHSTRLSSYAMNIQILCQLTRQGLEKWQLDTYTKIRQAYEKRKSIYEEQLLLSQAQEESLDFLDLGESKNLEIVKNELKRSCISMLTQQHFDSFSSHTGRDSHQFPKLDFSRAEAEGKIIQFFEQAFEWSQMTYQFYPYFWGYKGNWMKKMGLNHPDSQFQGFLQSGAAKVVISIQPSYNDAVLHYLQNGTIWQGGKTPVIEDEMFLSIASELKQKVDSNGESEGEPWEVKIPTKLVMLQNDAILPDWTTL